MELIRVTKENLASEHICCAIANEKDPQVAAKKAWLAERMDDGLVFLKANARGKCFVEYLPAERAWAPVEAEGYLYIDCLWVSGQFKGHGYANLLMDECEADARRAGKRGLIALSSEKKRPFLSDPAYLRHRGFRTADAAEPYFELLYLPFDDSAPTPRFYPCAKSPRAEEAGYAVYYAHQCPYTAKYVPLLGETAKARGVPFRSIRFQTTEEARRAPCAYTSFSLFRDGRFVTHEMPSPSKFEKMLAENA